MIYVSNLSGRIGHSVAVELARIVMHLRLQTILFWLALAATVAPVGGAGADSRDHDAVRMAVERGEIRPLVDILAIVRAKFPGHVTGVEIERKARRWVYEFRIVDAKGRLFELYVDARTGEIERIKEK